MNSDFPRQPRLNTVVVLVVIALLMAAVLLYRGYQYRVSSLESTRKEMAAHTMASIAAEIERQVAYQRHLTQLFALAEGNHLADLVSRPDDDAAIARMAGKVSRYLPQAVNFTVADPQGKPLLPDTEKRLGKGCRADIRHYANSQHDNVVFVHSNPKPENYHFDTLAPIAAADGFKGIFFVSVSTRSLSSLLGRSRVLGHQFLLLRSDKEGLIDLNAEGSRPFMQRKTSLSQIEAQHVLEKREIPGTRWRLVDLYDDAVVSQENASLARQAALIWIGFALVSLFLLRRIQIEDARRRRAEALLVSHNLDLNKRVTQTSDELLETRTSLDYQSRHDSLTQLLNRSEFELRIGDCIQDARRDRSQCCLVYIDLDQFKLINDSCGHEAGDQLLKDIAHLLVSQFGKVAHIARFGGDEFAILLPGFGVDAALDEVDKLQGELRHYALKWGKKAFSVGMSVGIVAIDDTIHTSIDALRNADIACYAAKELGGGRSHVYSTRDLVLSKRAADLESVSDIPLAIEEGRFRLFAQRIVPTSREQAAGQRFEALIRLYDQKGELVPPGRFIPAAEKYGLMGNVDRWVINEAFATIQRFGRVSKDDDILLSINLSSQSVSDTQMLDYIDEKARQYDIDEASVTFEITETAAVNDMLTARGFIHELKERGFHFALDDFGTGSSSMSYLKALPVDYLKIDGCFIRNIGNDEVDRTLVASMNQTAHALGMTTVAEFVETDEIRAIITELGVDFAQGYGIGKPAPVDEILIRNHSEKLA